MEDLALSIRVAQSGWGLANVRTARIYHDSQPGDHKSDPAAVAAMDLVNRHYVMTKVLGRTGLKNSVKLMLWTMFQLLSVLVGRNPIRVFVAHVRGKLRALRQIAASR